MDLQTITKFISSVGIPGALLIYLVWRLDKFLTFLCGKLTTYNKEFQDIGFAITSVVEELQEMKNELKTIAKK